jgi:type I restriction enzyme S subunit
VLEFSDNVFVEVEENDFNKTEEGDILICVRNGSRNLIGKNAIITKTDAGTAFGAFMLVFRSVDYKYLYQLFDTDFYGREIHKNLGATINSINTKNFKKFRFPFPKSQERKAIATCLSSWDEAIKKLTALIANKELQKKGLMQQLLTGKKRLPGFDGEWDKLNLSNIAVRVNRKNKELNDTVVTISAKRGFVLQEDFFNKRVASNTLSNYTLVHKGEYCYNKSYSNGYPMGAFKRLDDFEKAVVTTLYICFKLKDNVDSNFMKQYFEAGQMIPGLMRIAQEGGRAHGLLNIGLKDFFGLELSIPSKQEQTSIASVLQKADQEIALLNKKLDQLKMQKKGLMQQLLTGKKRLKY